MKSNFQKTGIGTRISSKHQQPQHINFTMSKKQENTDISPTKGKSMPHLDAETEKRFNYALERFYDGDVQSLDIDTLQAFLASEKELSLQEGIQRGIEFMKMDAPIAVQQERQRILSLLKEWTIANNPAADDLLEKLESISKGEIESEGK